MLFEPQADARATYAPNRLQWGWEVQLYTATVYSLAQSGPWREDVLDGLSLNGSFVRLGNSGDVVSSDGNPVFTIARDQNAVTWHLTPKIGFRSLVVSWAEISNRQGRANRSVGRNTFSRANGEGRPYRIV